MSRIPFNVIVPTKERADVLYHCLRTLVAQDYDELTIIVSDNYSQDHTEEVVRSLGDPRIRYVNPGKRLSMAENWEYGLSHAKEGWAMILGDDDGLYPWALRTLDELIGAHKVEAVSSAYGHFQWPGHFGNDAGGSMLIPLTSQVKIKSTRKELRKVLSFNASHNTLPWLYEGGAASLALINRARDARGRFFCSPIPDLYSAIALSCATKTYLSVGVPIAISGTSRHSNGAAHWRASSGHDDTVIRNFKAENTIPFHESLIFGKSPQIMVYESYLQSWHLHQGKLRVSLADQLDLALKIASPADTKAIESECAAIAKKNGLPFTNPRRPGKGRFLKLLPARLRRAFWYLHVDPAELGIANIYDAAVTSAFIYKYVSSGGPVLREGRLLLNLLQRVASKGRAAALRKLPGRKASA